MALSSTLSAGGFTADHIPKVIRIVSKIKLYFYGNSSVIDVHEGVTANVMAWLQGGLSGGVDGLFAARQGQPTS
ncbi:MAG TPA: hypothetical protein VF774_15480 [Pseudoduganella sp.]|jgi:hypothetical protein